MNHSTLLSVRSLSLVIAEMYFRRVCLTQVLHMVLLNLVFFFPVFYQNRCQARLFLCVWYAVFCEKNLSDFAYNGQ